MAVKILIIDDEGLFREDIAILLRRRGCECRTAPDGEKGQAIAEEFLPDVVLCDISLPGISGIEVLEQILRINPKSFIIMITAYGTVETAIEAFRKGASDYIMKPLIIEDVLQKIERLMEHKRLLREISFLRRKLSEDVESLSLVGQSEKMKEVLELAKKVAPTRSTVFISGASGTGKELIARAIHDSSDSPDEPFVAINCAGIPEYLLESELFGHTKGAFTGAISDREGFFELAGKGTILLDEIGEMARVLQSKLLRVLEEREFIPVGGNVAVPLKARIIASTNKKLEELVEAGQFRQDLYFRLMIFEIHLPDLKKHQDDIPLLCEHFIKKFNKELKRNCLGVDNEVIRRLMAYSWPGNVRELRNVIERAMILSQGDYITLVELPAQITSVSQFSEYSDDLRAAMATYEREHIRRVLLSSGGNREKTARRLGINPSTLYRKMTELGLMSEPSS
ncbi:MAG: sigma-54-dependent Fis family transcriptional regulator [Planctomycetes bacterium]|nr:sigma-54-dependent Fis family transcriptional regulator [Planctomycetota bacterium]MCH8120619.1 sigma-54-dependent Fis family transcriptional regulator [Planctomycetota bacterium]